MVDSSQGQCQSIKPDQHRIGAFRGSRQCLRFFFGARGAPRAPGRAQGHHCVKTGRRLPKPLCDGNTLQRSRAQASSGVWVSPRRQYGGESFGPAFGAIPYQRLGDDRVAAKASSRRSLRIATTATIGSWQNRVPGGHLACPICVAGAPVQPGDLVIGDADGVVVIPRLEMAQVLDAAEIKLAAEKTCLQEIDPANWSRPGSRTRCAARVPLRRSARRRRRARRTTEAVTRHLFALSPEGPTAGSFEISHGPHP